MHEQTTPIDAPAPRSADGFGSSAVAERPATVGGSSPFRSALGACLAALDRAVVELLVLAVRGYQWTLSPLVGRQCRFQPTCSHYFIGAVRKYGALRGVWRGLARIGRCHPWHPGGYDPP